MDLNLPSEDGLHLAQRVRQTHPQARLIMPTARGGAGHMSAGYQSGTCPRPMRVGYRHLLRAPFAPFSR
jgi:DNA-binding response OmpR family regulator